MHIPTEQFLHLLIGKVQVITIAAVEVESRPHGWEEPRGELARGHFSMVEMCKISDGEG